jgi:hypothetical protein
MLVTPTGLEGDNLPVFIGFYASSGDPAPSVTRPLDGPDASDPSGLPRPTADLFVIAGATVARHGVEAGANRGDVQAVLLRAAEQASKLV